MHVHTGIQLLWVFECYLLSIARCATTAHEQFMQWFRESGGTHANIELRDFEGYGTGLLATESISHGELLMTIPSKVIMSRQMLTDSNDSYNEHLTNNVQNDEDLIAIMLAREELKGRDSQWSAYLKILPRYLPQPAHFTDVELQELEDPSLYARLRKLQHSLAMRADEVAAFICEGFDECSHEAAVSLFYWGVSMVQSRALTFRGQKHLCPLADMFNYAPRNDFRDANSGETFLHYHQLGAEGLQIYSDRDSFPGGQIFEDYGDNDDMVYFLYHGFIPDQNPFRCLSMDVDMNHVYRHPAKVQLLQKLGYRARPMFCIRENGEGMASLITVSMVGALAAYEADECLALLQDINVDEQKLIFESLQSAQCSSQTSELLTKSSTSNECQLIIALQVLCGQYGVLIGNERARTLLTMGLLTVNASIAHTTIGFQTTKAFDLSLLDDIEDALAKRDINESEARRLANMQLILRYRIMKKQLASSVLKIWESLSSKIRGNQIFPTLHDRVEVFSRWIDGLGCPKNVLKTVVDQTYRISAIATSAIRQDEVYLSVPTSAVMDAEVARNDYRFGSLLKHLERQFRRRDTYHELLLFLLHEYFVRRTESFWWPYLQLLPTEEEMNVPLFYSEDELAALEPSVLASQAWEYQVRVNKSFHTLRQLPVVEYFLPPYVLTFQNYRWATAILDSRSIWWSGKRHLVPILDSINCKEGPDRSRVHSTILDESSRHAVTKAPWAFSMGEQVYENYGQPNHIYYLYHGFFLADNSHDCILAHVHIEHELIADHPDIYLEHKLLLARAQYSQGRATFCLTYPLPPEFLEFIQLSQLLQHERLCDHKCAMKEAQLILQDILSLYSLSVPRTSKTFSSISEYLKAETTGLGHILHRLKSRQSAMGEL